MNRLLQGLGALSVGAGALSVWYAFQRQMCTGVGGGTGNCGPNVVYLVPGVLAVLLGLAILGFQYRS